MILGDSITTFQEGTSINNIIKTKDIRDIEDNILHPINPSL